MRVCVLGSGSKGNCTYIECGDTGILVDAGLSCAQIEKRLKSINVNPFHISAILVTHEHTDHIAGACNFSQKFGAKIYTHKDTWDVMQHKFDKLPSTNLVDIYDQDFCINDINIHPFRVSHDAVHCLGYQVGHKLNKVCVATDLGYMTPQILKNLSSSDLCVLEANHDIKTLINNPNYPLHLKNRILSNSGHLNNDATAEAIVQMLGYCVRGVILAHLSEHNNTPSLAFSTVANKLAQNGATINKDVYVDLGFQDKVSNIFKIKE